MTLKHQNEEKLNLLHVQNQFPFTDLLEASPHLNDSDH